MLKSMIIFLSMMLIFMTHPLSMGLILLLQTISISLIIGFLNLNYWYSYILMLIMVGGMLILFIYMTSIASNEKFKINNKLIIIFSLNILFIIMTYLIDYFKFNLINTSFNSMNILENTNFFISMTKFYNFPSNMLFILIFIHLLICLIAVVKISKTNQGPLRQMF